MWKVRIDGPEETSEAGRDVLITAAGFLDRCK